MARKLNLKNPTFNLIRVTAGARVPISRQASHFRGKPSKNVAYDKLVKVIKSCKIIHQDITADSMIDVFSMQYDDYELSMSLRRLSMANCDLPNT